MNVADNAEKALRMAAENRDLIFDTETTGVDWKVNSPIGYVVGAPSPDGTMRADEDCVYVPIRHGGGGNLLGSRPMTKPDDTIEVHPFEVALAKAIGSRTGDGRIIGHNTKFDCHMAANVGIWLGRRMACTQNQAALLDEYARSYSLSAVASELGVAAKKSEAMYEHIAKTLGVPAKKDAMAHYWKLSGVDPVAYEYAVGDGAATWEAYTAQVAQIEEQDLRKVADLENDLIWTIFRMERKGIRVDTDAIKGLREATEDSIREILKGFPVGFNMRSPKDVREVAERAGKLDWPLTEKGNPSFTERWLKTFDEGLKVVELRQLSNLLNSFVDPLTERHVFKGRVHASLHQLRNDEKGTISGRFSCSEPNLQQVPKRNKTLAKPFRRLFIPDDGYVFWERDYSQCEPRLFAHYSQDPNLLEGYNSTPFKDMHTVTAELLAVERDPTAKRMGMGILTGMQAASLANHMGVSQAQASMWMSAFFEAYPRIRVFQNNAKSRLKKRGYVHTLLGRRCRLEAPRWAYRGTSKIIQGGNADIIKYKLLVGDRMCEDAGDKVQILMTVHDSFNGQYEDTPEAKGMLEEIVKELEDVRSPPFNLSVPFLLEGGDGPNWSVATFGE